MKTKGIVIVILLVLLICVVAIVVFFALISMPDPERMLPTNSGAGELRVANHGGVSVESLSVTLEYRDGSSYVINIDGVYAGEPQKYSLPPDMPDGFAAVHITFKDSYLDVGFDSYAMAFRNSRVNELERDGLLIYFADFIGVYMYVISGETKLCYIRNSLDKTNPWVLLADPPPISTDPAGIGPGWDEWSSGWKNNKWEYIEKDE